jgi:5-methylcytosine-specific restriction endonuclease McrA
MSDVELIRCRDCSLPKPRKDFYSMTSGRPRMPCKECRRTTRKPLTSEQREQYRTYIKSWKGARLANGWCIRCKQKAVTNILCLYHWFQGIGNPYGLQTKNGGTALLQSIWDEQCGLCAVTGEPLIPGVNASLDHIVPRSKGGLSVRGNLRWVLLEVNTAKHDMSDEEFVALCRKVVAAHDSRK